MRIWRIVEYVFIGSAVALMAYETYLGNYLITHRSTAQSAAYPKSFDAHGDVVYISIAEWRRYWGCWVLMFLTGIVGGAASLIDEKSRKTERTDETDG